MNLIDKISVKDYNKYAMEKMPKSKTFTGCLKAFLVGGLICVLGQLLSNWAKDGLGLDKKMSSTFVSAVLIFLGAVVTAFGVYDVIGRFAGAGSIIPITGFSNSIVAPAMEYKSEGYVLGVGAKMFTIAGPVLVYGVCSSVVVGLIYFVLNALGVIQL